MLSLPTADSFRNRRRLSALLVPVVLLLAMAGCDTSLTPFAREGAYSVYGALDLGQSRQFVRVKPLNVPVGTDSVRSLGATVTLENLRSGRQWTMEDSLVRFTDDGVTTVTHNFWADVDLEPKTDYRFTVDGPRGTTTATTRTPTDTPAVVRPKQGLCSDRFEVTFREVEHKPLFVRVFFDYEGMNRVPLPRFEVDETGDGGFTVSFQPSDVMEDIVPLPEQPDKCPGFKDCSIPRCVNLDDNTIGVRYAYVSPQWTSNLPDPDRPFDPSINQDDIQNGAGFLGAFFQDQVTATVDTTAEDSLRRRGAGEQLDRSSLPSPSGSGR